MPETKETNIMRAIQLEASKHGCRLFRNNVGMAWQGGTVQQIGHEWDIKEEDKSGRPELRLSYPYRVKFGLCVGSADLIGWTSTGKFLAVECKTPVGKVKPEQQAFIDAVNSSGGLAFIARSVEEFIQKLG